MVEVTLLWEVVEYILSGSDYGFWLVGWFSVLAVLHIAGRYLHYS